MRDKSLLARGEAVFPGTVSGRVARFPDVGEILIAPDLTTAVALQACESPVRAVITSEGSFACHGANLMRANVADGGAATVWLTRCPDALTLPVGAHVEIDADARVWSREWTDDRDDHSCLSIARPGSWDLRSRDVVAWPRSGGSALRCYWPHRTYDRLTASFMAVGLHADLMNLTDRRVNIMLGADGALWFGADAPSTQSLAQTAVSPELGTPHLVRQIAAYGEILPALAAVDSQLPSPKTLEILTKLIRRYFTAFLTFHATYEAVLLAHFEDEIRLPEMSSLLVSWLLSERLALRNRKDLLDEPAPVKLPPFDVHEDLRVAATHFDEGPGQTYARRVFVTKEWKFFINKALFTRFAYTVAQLQSAGALPGSSELRQYGTAQLLSRLAVGGR